MPRFFGLIPSRASQDLQTQSKHDSEGVPPLEKCLSGCEEMATDHAQWTPADRKILAEIRAVLEKVVVHRIRAEEQEKRDQPNDTG